MWFCRPTYISSNKKDETLGLGVFHAIVPEIKSSTLVLRAQQLATAPKRGARIISEQMAATVLPDRTVGNLGYLVGKYYRTV